MRIAKTLIRLGGWSGWSESSLGAHVILLILSWGGSNPVWIRKASCFQRNSNPRDLMIHSGHCWPLGIKNVLNYYYHYIILISHEDVVHFDNLYSYYFYYYSSRSRISSSSSNIGSILTCKSVSNKWCLSKSAHYQIIVWCVTTMNCPSVQFIDNILTCSCWITNKNLVVVIVVVVAAAKAVVAVILVKLVVF